MSENKNIEVGGRLHSIATGNVLAGANEIFDDDKNKKQNDINTETYSLVNNINERLNSLSPDQQDALDVATKATNNETKLGYYVCDTEGNVATKVISDATGYILSKGGSMKVKMTNVNTANNATLNINSTGAKALYYAGERASANNSWEAGETVEVYYDGTSYYANSVIGGVNEGIDDIKKHISKFESEGNSEILTGTLDAYGFIVHRIFEKGTIIKNVTLNFANANSSVKIYSLVRNDNTWTLVDLIKNVGSVNTGEQLISLDYICKYDCYLFIYGATTITLYRADESNIGHIVTNDTTLTIGSSFSASIVSASHLYIKIDFSEDLYDVQDIVDDLDDVKGDVASLQEGITSLGSDIVATNIDVSSNTSNINILLDAISESSLNGNPSVKNSGMNGRGIVFDRLFSQGTYIKSITFKSKTAGTNAHTHIYVVTKNGDTFTLKKDLADIGVLLTDHVYNVELNYACVEGCYLMLYADSESLEIYQSNDTNINAYRCTVAGLSVNSTFTQSSLFGYYPNVIFSERGEMIHSSDIEEEVNYIEDDVNGINSSIMSLEKNMGVLFDRVTDFSESTHLLTDFTLNNDNKPISSGSSCFYVYNKRFISDQRKASYDIEIPSASTPIIRVGSLQNRVASNQSYSTCVEYNRSTGKLIVYKGGGSNGTSTLTQIAEASIVNTISSLRLLFIIERNKKVTTLTVYDYYTRVSDSVSFDGNNVLFVNGAGNHRPYYFAWTNTSGVKLNRLEVFGCYKVGLVHLGDSLSESNGRCDDSINNYIGENFIEKVMGLIGWNGSIVAQSGGDIDDVMDALTNEVAFIKPEAISVMIGTNGGATIEQYQSLVSWCSSRNIPLIMCNIPMTYTRDPEDVNSAEYVASEIDELDVQVVRMNDATATNGNAVNGADLSCFASGDKLHTNQLGNNRMYERYLMDAPQIMFYKR